MTAPSLASDFPWHPRNREAHLLAGLLRTSRLTVLYGDAGSGKSTLLKTGVLPLLRRRASDTAIIRSKESGVVVRFPDRRANGQGAERGAEVAVFFDAWNESPLVALRARLQEAMPLALAGTAPASQPLTTSLAAWNSSLGARFLIILDRFEDYLAMPPEQAGVGEFADEIVEAVNHARLRVNFLISLRDDAGPLLERFRSRIPGFGDASLRLPPLHRAPPAPLILRQESDMPPVPPAASAPADPGWVEDWRKPAPERANDEIAAPLEGPVATASADVAAETPIEPAVEQPATPVVSQASPVVSQASVESSIAALTAELDALAPEEPWNNDAGKPRAPTPMYPDPLQTPDSRLPSGPGRGKWLAPLGLLAITLVTALLVIALWPMPRRNTLDSAISARAPVAQQPVAPAPAVDVPRPPVAALPKFGILADAGNATDWRVAQDLARIVAPRARIELGVKPSAGWFNSLTSQSAQGQVAIVHYDALQMARKVARESRSINDGKASDPLRIVTPLFTEEIYFITRRNSPLDYIHEIRGKKINIGPEEGGRALTASTIYQRMFGTIIPVSEISHLGEQEALRRLVTDKSIDVMVVVTTEPAPMLAGMTAEMADSIKLLELARDEPASRKALQAYLPATVKSPLSGEKIPTLAVMSFLVTANTTDPAVTERLQSFTRALCTNLSALRQNGHPKWREVQPGLKLEAGLPYSPATEAAFQSCLEAKPVASNP